MPSKSLWELSVDTDETNWSSNPGDRKYTRNYPVSMDAEMYQILQELARHPDLPFNGNGSALARQLFAAGIDALKQFLDSGQRSMWERLREQQRLLTAEKYAMTINDLMDKQVEALQLWTTAGEWSAVLEDLRRTSEVIDSYPSPHWKRYAARQWVGHKNLRELFRYWEERMRDESPLTWTHTRNLFDKMHELSGL